MTLIERYRNQNKGGVFMSKNLSDIYIVVVISNKMTLTVYTGLPNLDSILGMKRTKG